MDFPYTTRCTDALLTLYHLRPQRNETHSFFLRPWPGHAGKSASRIQRRVPMLQDLHMSPVAGEWEGGDGASPCRSQRGRVVTTRCSTVDERVSSGSRCRLRPLCLGAWTPGVSTLMDPHLCRHIEGATPRLSVSDATGARLSADHVSLSLFCPSGAALPSRLVSSGLRRTASGRPDCRHGFSRPRVLAASLPLSLTHNRHTHTHTQKSTPSARPRAYALVKRTPPSLPTQSIDSSGISSGIPCLAAHTNPPSTSCLYTSMYVRADAGHVGHVESPVALCQAGPGPEGELRSRGISASLLTPFPIYPILLCHLHHSQRHGKCSLWRWQCSAGLEQVNGHPMATSYRVWTAECICRPSPLAEALLIVTDLGI